MDKLKILQLKVLLVILEILLVLLIWTLVQLIYHKSSEVREGKEAQRVTEELVMSDIFVERDVASEKDSTTIPAPEPTPFVLSNFDKIRVVLTNKDTGGIYHETSEEWLKRTDYRGTIEVYEEPDGFVVVNELPIEEYLYSVVPSEMPADYPLEALKAQAICARTYAYLHVLSPGYPKWNAHVDDTTAYQVYHNQPEMERSNRAVNETEGMVLLDPTGNALAQTYYYSTSCGYGSDAHVWRTKYSDSYPYIKSRHINSTCEEECSLTEEEYCAYLNSVNEEDFEAAEPWYRWTYEVEALDAEHMLAVLKERYKANPKLILTKKGNDYVSQSIKAFDKVENIEIVKREAGGVADEMLIVTNKKTYKVITELNIRYVLNDGSSEVIRQDGSSVEMNKLLPSAFIWLEPEKGKNSISGYKIYGGGYGHGAGMSQNGAKAMALSGMNAEDILTFFFSECMVEEK